MAAMAEVRARSIDPRDSRWEELTPRFRVYFWAPAGDGWASREFEVEADDVDAVRRWIEEHRAEAETFTLFAVVDRNDERGLLRLLGTDPTRSA